MIHSNVSKKSKLLQIENETRNNIKTRLDHQRKGRQRLSGADPGPKCAKKMRNNKNSKNPNNNNKIPRGGPEITHPPCPEAINAVILEHLISRASKLKQATCINSTRSEHNG